jgi:hypothetical protein
VIRAETGSNSISTIIQSLIELTWRRRRPPPTAGGARALSISCSTFSIWTAAIPRVWHCGSTKRFSSLSSLNCWACKRLHPCKLGFEGVVSKTADAPLYAGQPWALAQAGLVFHFRQESSGKERCDGWRTNSSKNQRRWVKYDRLLEQLITVTHSLAIARGATRLHDGQLIAMRGGRNAARARAC